MPILQSTQVGVAVRVLLFVMLQPYHLDYLVSRSFVDFGQVSRGADPVNRPAGTAHVSPRPLPGRAIIAGELAAEVAVADDWHPLLLLEVLGEVEDILLIDPTRVDPVGVIIEVALDGALVEVAGSEACSDDRFTNINAGSFSHKAIIYAAGMPRQGISPILFHGPRSDRKEGPS